MEYETEERHQPWAADTHRRCLEPWVLLVAPASNPTGVNPDAPGTNRPARSGTNRLSAVLVTLEQASGVFVAQAQRLNSEIRSRAVTEHYELLEAYEQGVVERALDIQLAHLNLPLEVFDIETDS